MPQPRVSVIVPCYNAEKYIAATLESILAQTVGCEIAVIDDGSTDETSRILDSYAPQVTVLRNDGGRNLGPAASRNLGIARTSAPFVAFLDADDLWSPTKLALECAVMAADPRVGVVVSSASAIDGSGAYLYHFPPFPEVSEQDLAAHLLLDNFIQTPGQALIRRDVLEEVGGFDPDLWAVEDHDLWIRLAERTRFAFLSDVTTHYRKHSASISTASARRMWTLGFDVLTKAEQRQNYGTAASCRRAVLHFRLAQCAFREKAYIEALIRGARAVACDPSRAAGLLLRLIRPV